MQQHTPFRISTYLSLLISTACLATAEAAELPNTIPFFIGIGVLLVAEYYSNERWLLPIWASNLLAVVIVIGWVLWFASGVEASEEDFLANLLPRSGPLLGALLVAKLLRPKKANDFWMLHLLGLVQVVLAAVLALQTRMDRKSTLFFLLLIGYLFSFIWAMLHFARQREQEAVAGPPPGKRRSSGERSLAWKQPGPMPASEKRLLLPALRWFVVGGVLGLLIFFAVPRPGMDLSATLVLPGASRAQTGFSPGLDLNETTPIEVSEEEVMRVEATDAAGRRIMLDCDGQRWRGVTCSLYQRGRWSPVRGGAVMPLQMRSEPEVEAGEVRLNFYVDVSKIQSAWYGAEEDRAFELFDRPTTQPVFLAEPVLTRGRTTPMIGLENPRDRLSAPMTYRNLEATLSVPAFRRSRRLAYVQVFDWTQAGQSDWSQTVSLPLQQPGTRDYWESLLALPLPAEDLRALTTHTREILRAAAIDPNVDESRLSGAERRERRIAIARALTARLSQSLDYTYTLERPRQDMDRDPTVDFLLNTKSGHCGMYASALALMLRTQKIPSRVVIGFRGARWYSVGEYHSVCQFHSHAWVEAFIEDADSPPIPPRMVPGSAAAREAQAANMKPTTGRWLTLDPTPGGGTAAIAGFSAAELWRDFTHFLRYLWEFFILEYNGETQQARILAQLRTLLDRREWAAAWQSLSALFQQAWWFRVLVMGGVAGTAVVTVLLIRRVLRALGRRKRAVVVVPGFLGQLLRLLARAGLRPEASQTPAEFARQASTWLQQSPATAPLRDVPLQVVEDYYAVRFGQQELSAEQSARIRSQLKQLQIALANR